MLEIHAVVVHEHDRGENDWFLNTVRAQLGAQFCCGHTPSNFNASGTVDEDLLPRTMVQVEPVWIRIRL
jgi:hypothetical protein